MLPKNYQRPIARTDELPLELRRTKAEADLKDYVQRAQEQRELNEYAVAASSDVLKAVSLANLPYAHAFADFLIQAGAAQTASTDRISAQEMAQALVAPPSRSQPDKKDVRRTLAKATHPDTTADTNDALLAKKRFQDLETAKRVGDTATQLSEYAQVLAADENKDIAQLELNRYKAWLALEGSKGKFASVAEVDEWKDNELVRTPFTARFSSMAILAQQLGVTLGANPETGELIIPQGLYGPLKAFNETWKRITKASNDSSAKIRTEFTMFDTKMAELLSLFAELVKNFDPQGKWDNERFLATRKIMNRLGGACEMLEVPKETSIDIQDLIFNGLSKIAGARRPGDSYFTQRENPERRYGQYPNW